MKKLIIFLILFFPFFLSGCLTNKFIESFKVRPRTEKINQSRFALYGDNGTIAIFYKGKLRYNYIDVMDISKLPHTKYVYNSGLNIMANYNQDSPFHARFYKSLTKEKYFATPEKYQLPLVFPGEGKNRLMLVTTQNKAIQYGHTKRYKQVLFILTFQVDQEITENSALFLAGWKLIICDNKDLEYAKKLQVFTIPYDFPKKTTILPDKKVNYKHIRVLEHMKKEDFLKEKGQYKFPLLISTKDGKDFLFVTRKNKKLEFHKLYTRRTQMKYERSYYPWYSYPFMCLGVPLTFAIDIVATPFFIGYVIFRYN